MTFVRLVISSVYTRSKVCKLNISHITYCCHSKNKDRDTMKAMAAPQNKLVAEFRSIRRSENSNELPGNNGKIKQKPSH